MGCDTMVLDILALVLSLLAIIISIMQHISEKNRCRKEATIHAFDALEKDVFAKKAYKNIVVRQGTDYALNPNFADDVATWNEATLALSQIEHFAVGVNSGVYDLDTLNRMAGSFIIKEYSRWKPIIETKRKQSPQHKHYDEFESLCIELEKKRT